MLVSFVIVGIHLQNLSGHSRVQVFQRWFYMRIRYKTFTLLLDLNQCLKEHLALFNRKQHRIFKRTREEMFENEKTVLQKLPEAPYKVATYHRATLSRECQQGLALPLLLRQHL